MLCQGISPHWDWDLVRGVPKRARPESPEQLHATVHHIPWQLPEPLVPQQTPDAHRSTGDLCDCAGCSFLARSPHLILAVQPAEAIAEPREQLQAGALRLAGSAWRSWETSGINWSGAVSGNNTSKMEGSIFSSSKRAGNRRKPLKSLAAGYGWENYVQQENARRAGRRAASPEGDGVSDCRRAFDFTSLPHFSTLTFPTLAIPKCPRVQQGRASPLGAQGSGRAQHHAAGLRGSVPGAGGPWCLWLWCPQSQGLRNSRDVSAACAESQNCHRSLYKPIFTSLSVARQRRAGKLQNQHVISGLLGGAFRGKK